MTRYCLPVLTGMMILAAARAQGPALKFNWHKGQVLVYKVEQVTTTTLSSSESSAETKIKLNITKRWQVAEVDSAGTATLELSMPAMRYEETLPAAPPAKPDEAPKEPEVLLFDSANLDKSSPAMRKAMEGFIGKTLAVLRVDASGRVLEVKQSRQNGSNVYEARPPFVAVVPQQPVQTGHFWERNYNITLDPPTGTGEKVPAVQRYTCKVSTPNSLILQIGTTLKKEPEAAADRIPLLQWLPQGEVEFDPTSGIMRSAKMKIEQEVKGFQGEGSTYRLQDSYVEEYAGAQ